MQRVLLPFLLAWAVGRHLFREKKPLLRLQGITMSGGNMVVGNPLALWLSVHHVAICSLEMALS